MRRALSPGQNQTLDKGKIMGWLIKTILLSVIFLTACSSNMNRALYEGIQNQNEINKSPAERAISPTPNYKDYQSERENLKKKPLPAE
jgi:hypothetical protein